MFFNRVKKSPSHINDVKNDFVKSDPIVHADNHRSSNLFDLPTATENDKKDVRKNRQLDFNTLYKRNSKYNRLQRRETISHRLRLNKPVPHVRRMPKPVPKEPEFLEDESVPDEEERDSDEPSEEADVQPEYMRMKFRQQDKDVPS